MSRYRWSQAESDEARLPDGVRRTGYDADTQTYSYSDRNGRRWEGASGARYGTLNQSGGSGSPSRNLPIFSDPIVPHPQRSGSWWDFLPIRILSDRSSDIIEGKEPHPSYAAAALDFVKNQSDRISTAFESLRAVRSKAEKQADESEEDSEYYSAKEDEKTKEEVKEEDRRMMERRRRDRERLKERTRKERRARQRTRSRDERARSS